MQLITQNRFVEPTTTGTIEWAGLGLLFVYLLFPAPTLVQRMTGAIIFSFIGTMIFFLFLRRVKLRSSLIVPIIGYDAWSSYFCSFYFYRTPFSNDAKY